MSAVATTGIWPRAFTASARPTYGKKSPCEPQQLITIRLDMASAGYCVDPGFICRRLCSRLGLAGVLALFSQVRTRGRVSQGSSPLPQAASTADHEIDDSPAHVDRALHRLAVEMPADVLIRA